MPLWRGQQQYVYHTCSRCGTRQPLSKMQWQNGILVCSYNQCVDTAILGKHDVDISREVSINRHEMEPDSKLTDVVDRKDDTDDVLY